MADSGKTAWSVRFSSRADARSRPKGFSRTTRALSAPPGHRIYNLGESATISLADLVSLLETATGLPAKREFLPVQPGDVAVTYADISRARAEIGYDPKVPVAAGVDKFVAWFRDNSMKKTTN